MFGFIAGWTAVAAIGVVLVLLVGLLCGLMMRGLAGTVLVVVLSFPAMWLLSRYVFADASVHFPSGTFSDGADGQEQIVIVSVMMTVLCGVAAATVIVWLLKRLDHMLSRRNSNAS